VYATVLHIHMCCIECGLIVTVHWLLGRKVVKKAKVMHEYKAENPDELNIEVGQIIEILKQVFYVFLLQCMSYAF